MLLDARVPRANAITSRLTYPRGLVGSPAWSANERFIAFGDGYAIGVVDLESGAEQVFELDAIGAGLSSDEPLDRLWALAWTPDGAIEFATSRALWRLDPETRTARRVADAPRPGGFTQGTTLAFLPDGGGLVAATRFGVFAQEEAGTWRVLSSAGLPFVGGALHLAPDGSALVFAAESGHLPEGIIVVPLDGSGAYRLVAPGAGRVLGWLADGRLVWVSATGGV